MKKFLLYTLISILLLSCSDSDEPTKEILFTIDRESLQFEQLEGESTLKVTANTSWKVTDIPSWVTLSIDESSKSEDVIITTRENTQQTERSAIINFVGKDINIPLTIYQEAKKDDITWQYFIPSLSRFDVKYALGANNISRIYTFDRYTMFVNPDTDPTIQSKIFLGNMINRSTLSPTNIESYEGYTFNQSAISTSSTTVYGIDYTPSLRLQKEYVDKIIASKPKQNLFFSSRQIDYSSHRELHLLGMGNLGMALDEIISGYSYREQDMTRSSGLIYFYNQTLFSVDMDTPDSGSLVKEKLKEEDYPNKSLAYIGSVYYGRIGMLIIESDLDNKEIKKIVSMIIQNQTLNDTENEIVNNLDAYHVYYDNNYKLQVVKGKLDAIQSYKNVTFENPYKNAFIYQFDLCDYFNHGMSFANYKVELP